MDTAVVIAIVASAGVVFTALAGAAGAWFGRRSTSTSDSTHTDVDTLVTLALSGLREQVDVLAARVTEQDERITAQDNEINQLRAERSELVDQLAAVKSELATLHDWVRAQGADPELIVGGVADGYVFPFDDVDG